jgi:hypothetical protein
VKAVRIWLFVAALASVPAISRAAPLQFSIELNAPYKGNSVCNVSFHHVPGKAAVDKMMLDALAICRAVDPGNDIQVMAFHDDDALDDTQATYSYLVWHHATGKIEKTKLSDIQWNETKR